VDLVPLKVRLTVLWQSVKVFAKYSKNDSRDVERQTGVDQETGFLWGTIKNSDRGVLAAKPGDGLAIKRRNSRKPEKLSSFSGL